MSNPTETVAAVLQAYKTAVYDKDVRAFAALYDDDIQVFDMWGEWSHNGIAAWRGMATSWFESLGTERVVVGIDGVQGYVSGAFAAGHAFLTYAAVSSGGEELRSLSNRITLILRKAGDSWKIIHEHTSAPVDFNTMKVTLQR